MDAKQLHILQHSLGLDQYGRGTFYRNRFVTGAGSKDHADCMALVELGHMTRVANVKMFGGDDYFTVTETGKRAAVENSPAPPKLTRSQQNYQGWLNYDSDMSFMDYVKMKSHLRAKEAGRA